MKTRGDLDGRVKTAGHPGRVSETAIGYLREVVEYGFGNSSGPGLRDRFERAFAQRFGVRHALAVCNGTATMHCGLAAAGVKPGDEVIVPPLTGDQRPKTRDQGTQSTERFGSWNRKIGKAGKGSGLSGRPALPVQTLPLTWGLEPC